jgi:hypothetical protein
MRRYNNLCLSLGSHSLFICSSHLSLASLMLCSHPWGPAHARTHTHTHTHTRARAHTHDNGFIWTARLSLSVLSQDFNLLYHRHCHWWLTLNRWPSVQLFIFSSLLLCEDKYSFQTSHWSLQILLVFSSSDSELNLKAFGGISWMLGRHGRTILL